MASLKDIATELNLSVPLVSTVLNGKLGAIGCSEKNREAILAKAKELNYQPNRHAQALRSGRTGTVAVFIHPLGEAGSDLLDRLLLNLTQEADRINVRLWINFYQSNKDFLSRLSTADKSELDGLLVAGIFHPRLESKFKEIEQNGIPVVTMVKNGQANPGRINIHCDEFQLGYLPTRHLLELGCKRIAHIHSMDARYEGYRKALAEFGILEDPNLVYTAIQQFKAKTGYDAISRLMDNHINFDGLVAESDHQAFGALNELSHRGITVPDAVKVFGVDNSPICSLSPIGISSVSQEMEKIGKQALQVIMSIINGEKASSVTVQPALKLRASTES